MEKKRKPILIVAIILLLNTLSLTGYLLYLVFTAIFLDNPFEFWPFFLVLIAIVLSAQIAAMIIKKNAKPTVTNKEQESLGFGIEDTGSSLTAVSESGSSDEHLDSLSDSLGGNAWDKEKAKEIKKEAKPKPKADPKKIVPAVVFALVLIIFIIVYQYGGIPSFGGSNPEGRWILEMDEGSTQGGILNLTDYWYIEFYEDGTLDTGIKNVGYAEESEGSGTWAMADGIITATIYYDYGLTSNLRLKISGNKLVDADTGTPSGYVRD